MSKNVKLDAAKRRERREQTSRREFLTTLAAGAALTPAMQSTLFGAAPTPQSSGPRNLRIGGDKAVLRPEDISYRGVFRVPLDPGGSRFGFSNGALAGRRVGGQLQLFMAGSKPSGDPIYEFGDPGVGATPASAPVAPFIRNWGDVYQGQRTTYTPGVGLTTRGLLWANGQLYWAYGNEYAAGGSHDPSIGTSVLGEDGHVTTYGAWRTKEHSQKTRGYMVEIPEWFATRYTGGRRWGIGAPITSGNAASPWGTMLTAATFPGNSTPPSAPRGGDVAIPTMNLIYHDIKEPQRRDANYRQCGWNVQYDASKGAWTKPGAPRFTSIDLASAAVWIDLPTKHGVLFLGQLATTIPGYPYQGGDTMTHVWYGPNVCPHGQDANPVSVSVGDATGTSAPYFWIYNPDDLAQAALRRMDPDSFDPASEGLMLKIAGSPFASRAHALYQFGGAFFDAPTGRLFVSEIQAIVEAGEPRPLIHVFDIHS